MKKIKKPKKAIIAINQLTDDNIDAIIDYITLNSAMLSIYKEKINTDALSNVYHSDYLKNNGSVDILRKIFYKDILGEEAFLKQTISASIDTAINNNLLDNYLENNKMNFTSTESYELLYQKLQDNNFVINDGNRDLLYKSPVVLEYFLNNENFSNDYKHEMLTKSPVPNINTFFIPHLKYSSIHGNLVSILQNFPELANNILNNIGVSTLPETPTQFQLEWAIDRARYIMMNSQIPEMPLTLIETLAETFTNNGQNNRDFLHELLGNNEAFYNINSQNMSTKDWDSLFSVINECHLNSVEIGTSFLKNNSDVFQANGFISPKDIAALNRNAGTTNYNENYEKDLLNDLQLESTPKSFEDVIVNIKDKKMKDLSLEESNILLGYAQKLLSKHGIKDVEITYSHIGHRENYSGIASYTTIDLCINDRNVRQLIHTIHHEVNHIIQKHNAQSMDIVADEDIITYSKDRIIRYINNDYYNVSYYSQSFEFDADFKAHLLDKALFGESIIFDEALQTYHDMNKYHKAINRKQKDGTWENMDDIFRKTMQKKFETASKDELTQLSAFINIYHPIIAYEYDLQTGKPRTISDLVNCANTVQDSKISNIIKQIIKQKCDPNKVGDDIAEQNRKELQEKIQTLNMKEKMAMRIKSSKDYYHKYERYANEVLNNTIDQNKTVSAAR